MQHAAPKIIVCSPRCAGLQTHVCDIYRHCTRRALKNATGNRQRWLATKRQPRASFVGAQLPAPASLLVPCRLVRGFPAKNLVWGPGCLIAAVHQQSPVLYRVSVCTTPCTQGGAAHPVYTPAAAAQPCVFPAKNPRQPQKGAVQAVVRPPALHGNRLGVLGAAMANFTPSTISLPFITPARLHHLLPLGTPPPAHHQHQSGPTLSQHWRPTPAQLNLYAPPRFTSPNTRHTLHNRTQPWLPGPCTESHGTTPAHTHLFAEGSPINSSNVTSSNNPSFWGAGFHTTTLGPTISSVQATACQRLACRVGETTRPANTSLCRAWLPAHKVSHSLTQPHRAG